MSAPHPDLLLPPAPSTLARLRDEAAASGDDARLLALHELERAAAALPPVIDGARRTRLVAIDALATTWEAWRVHDGRRCLLRCLRARWREDAVMRRRFDAAPARIGALHPVELRVDGDWPHLRVDAPGAPLVDRLPVEDPPDAVTLARILAGGLAGLSALHGAGLVHGGPMGPLLLHGAEGTALRWLDPFDPRRDARGDLAALAALVAALDPDGVDPVGQLAHGWTQAPPPSAEDGLQLLRATLGGQLLGWRHQLALGARRLGRRDRAARLAQATRALSRVLPPPATTGCLSIGADGVMVLIWSDGRAVRGGEAGRLDPALLPPVFDPVVGLEAQAARRLLRAWASRAPQHEAARQAVQATLGATDEGCDALLRWLRTMAGLRRARLLSEHQARPGEGGADQSRTTPTR